MVKVDLRTITLNVPPQEVITKDNVPVRVNAVAYFRIVEPKAAIVQVENYMVATSQIAQTTLRSVLGQHVLDELLSERDKINQILQSIIDEADLPVGHQDLDRRGEGRRDPVRHAARDGATGGGRARAPREGDLRRGRVPGLGAAQGRGRSVMAQQPITVQLRYLQTLLEIGATDNNSATIVFPIPIEFFETLGLFQSKRLATRCARSSASSSSRSSWFRSPPLRCAGCAGSPGRGMP